MLVLVCDFVKKRVILINIRWVRLVSTVFLSFWLGVCLKFWFESF